MLIKQITIENFQSYFGSQTIPFSEGLNLIIGKGGKGKSKLFNAFYWVLFGKIYITDVGWCDTDRLPQSSKGQMKKHEYLNKRALSLAKVNDKVFMAVQVEIEDDKGITYIIERSVCAVRDKGDDWDDAFSWDIKPNILKVSYDSPNGTQVKIDVVAKGIIDNLFPEDIRNYIWFQGESLESLIDFTDKETLQKAVKHISYYPFYERLTSIISKSKTKIERLETSSIRDANKHNTEVSSLTAQIDFLRNKINNQQAERDKVQHEYDLVTVALAEDDNKLKGLASYTSLVNEYADKKRAFDELKQKTFDIDEYQRKQLVSTWMFRGIEPLLEQCKDLFSQHTEEVITKPEAKFIENPSIAKLQAIIHDKQCFVCGSEVLPGNKAFKWINKRIEEKETFDKEMAEYQANQAAVLLFEKLIGKIEDYPDNLLTNISGIDKQWKSSELELEHYMALRKDAQNKLKECDEKIDEAKRQYGVDPVKQAGIADSLSHSIHASRTNQNNLQRRLITIDASIKADKDELASKVARLEEIGSEKGGTCKIHETEWKYISTFLEDICARVQENARKELLQKIEHRANQFYDKFTEHDTGYKGNVKIDEDYTIEFDAGLNTSNEDRKKMSIINAMLSLNQEALNIYYPFISDAPTSNFDAETTHKYLLGIKDVFDQSIIMTKDVDIESEAYQYLISQSNVSRIYELESDIHVLTEDKPKLNEVSTKVNPLK